MSIKRKKHVKVPIDNRFDSLMAVLGKYVAALAAPLAEHLGVARSTLEASGAAVMQRYAGWLKDTGPVLGVTVLARASACRRGGNGARRIRSFFADDGSLKFAAAGGETLGVEDLFAIDGDTLLAVVALAAQLCGGAVTVRELFGEMCFGSFPFLALLGRDAARRRILGAGVPDPYRAELCAARLSCAVGLPPRELVFDHVRQTERVARRFEMDKCGIRHAVAFARQFARPNARECVRGPLLTPAPETARAVDVLRTAPDHLVAAAMIFAESRGARCSPLLLGPLAPLSAPARASPRAFRDFALRCARAYDAPRAQTHFHLPAKRAPSGECPFATDTHVEQLFAFFETHPPCDEAVPATPTLRVIPAGGMRSPVKVALALYLDLRLTVVERVTGAVRAVAARE
eukprot:gnl/Chilomastix_cuspidata/1387.p1 GENE.gnl/Chilomastix_cuspidata/1387~~gnl/Chilomastix_cuspidata/1387.p1  ORF type:complete len:403 (+),score=103.83 gnl/Chilomastix_cuspidata/1387:280-1488(+)